MSDSIPKPQDDAAILMSQYVTVAMTFHAALIPVWLPRNETARMAFDQADTFFAELARRTKS